MNNNIRMSIAFILRDNGFTNTVTRENLLRLFGSAEQVNANKFLREQGVVQGDFYGASAKFLPTHDVAYPQWILKSYRIPGQRAKYDISPLIAELEVFERKLAEKQNAVPAAATV